jgi:predicted O-methyltransferase YrrM
MEERAEKEDFPIIGPDVGHFLYLLTRSMEARKVLELGSGFGYSALFFGRALPAEGTVVCTDMFPGNKTDTEKAFREMEIPCELRFYLGDALDTARSLEETFDIVFNDIDKEDYVNSIDAAWERLRPGGLFITDNVLWYGIVTNPETDDKTARSVRQFNDALQADKRFETSWVPLRDGLTLSRKI